MHEKGSFFKKIISIDHSLDFTTLNMICSVLRLYLVLLPPYHAQTLISNSLIISVRHKMHRHLPYYHLLSPFIIVNFFHILTNTKFVHVTSTCCHSWYLVFEITYFHSIRQILQDAKNIN